MSFSYRRLSGFKDDLYPGGLSGRFETRPIYPEIEVTSDPDIDLVSLASVKNEQRVRHGEDDTLLEGYILQAIHDVEEFVGRAIATQEITVHWKLVYDYVWLPRPPQQSIDSVTEIDDDGTRTTISTDEYDTFGRNELKIEFDSPIERQLEVVMTCGYGGKVTDIPRWAKTAVHWQAQLYYQKNSDLAIDERSGLAVLAYLAAKNHTYDLPE